MNYKEKLEAHKRLRDLFTPVYQEGCIKCSNETMEHLAVKAQIVWWLKKQGYSCYTEARLKDNSRPDIIALKDQHGVIIEVCHSESERKLADKMKDTCYENFYVMKVNTKDFNIATFAI
jgi:competence CoiA-like predicted nuclease